MYFSHFKKYLLRIELFTETYTMTNPKKNILQPRPYLLTNKIQHYAWGSRGDLAFIPKLTGITPENDTTYAELWMGAHPSAPSTVNINGREVPLTDMIDQFGEQILGTTVQRKFDGKLPFLFKVLSAEQALSIQAHPNKSQAVKLHRNDPEHYPDDNHKPEIAIAVDSLTALVGFKSVPDLAATFGNYPEISHFIGNRILEKFRNAIDKPALHRDLLKEMYSLYIGNSMNLSDKLAHATDELEERLRASKIALTEEETLFLEQKDSYASGDVGLFSIFLLNLVHLNKGEGIFLDAGIPHAYIKGNIVECMANSDNVVRAGLTPKFKDVETLVDILTYESGLIPVIGAGEEADEKIYTVPISEFETARYNFKIGQKKEFTSNQTPHILLVFEGKIEIQWDTESKIYGRGDSVLIPAFLNKFSLTATEPSTLFKVTVPV